MNMTVKKIAYVLTAVASVVTMGIGFSTMDSLSSAALLFLFVAITPYIIMSFVISKSEYSLSLTVNIWLSIFLTLLGTATLAYEMFIHKDAQSALSFVVIPVYQLCVFAIVSFVVYLVAKRY
jgi:hypothetical protein